MSSIEADVTGKKLRIPGYRSVLIADRCFADLKEMQSYRTCGHLPVRFDLKDLASAVIAEAMVIPAFATRVLECAFDTARRDGVPSISSEYVHDRKVTPGYRSVLISDQCFGELKKLQSFRTYGHRPVRVDLKFIASACIAEALVVPAFKEKALLRALADAHKMITRSIQSTLVKETHL